MDCFCLAIHRETYSEDGNVTKSVITLTPVPDDNGAQLVCMANNFRITNGSSIEDIWTLNVLCMYSIYKPLLSLIALQCNRG